jgi:hypothetical protein
MPMKLVGFTQHGKGWASFLVPPWVPKGGNLICTVTYVVLRSVEARRGSLPPVLKFTIDGGPENWNSSVFAFFAHLVTSGAVKEVWLLRMPVGHTHSDQDAKFSRLSLRLHGSNRLETGRSCNTPEEWAQCLRDAFLDEGSKPDVVCLSSEFDFASLYEGNLAPLAGYGPSVQYTAAAGEAPRQESERRSHLRVAHIRMDPGVEVATIRFAQSATAAERGEWYPLRPAPPPASPDAPKTWCSFANHVGAPVLRRLPDDAPTRVRYVPSEWDKLSAFRATLTKLDEISVWPPSAAEAWRAFLANPPCELQGVPWDIASLQPALSTTAAPAARAATGERLLVVDPLLTGTRSKKQKAADEVAAGCYGGGDDGAFDVPFEQLELGDYAFALAHEDALNAFTIRVKGKTSKRVELLEMAALGARKARA